MTLCAVALLANAGASHAEEQARQDVVEAEVADCTTRALSNELGMEIFGWAERCQQTAENKCATQPMTDDEVAQGWQRFSCEEYSGAAWQKAADRIKGYLVARWQRCAVPDDIKAAMVSRVERADAAAEALGEALCDYDAAQWLALGDSDMAIMQRRGCAANISVVRAGLLYNLIQMDAGCDAEWVKP
jgi:hypothetical protein